MITDASIKVKHYKCFGEEEQGFEKIYPLNIVIGKNNSGKSSLIDLIEYWFDKKSELLKVDNGVTKSVVTCQIDKNIIKAVGTAYANSQGNTDVGGVIQNLETQLSKYEKADVVKFAILKDRTFEFISNIGALGEYGNEFKFYFYNFFEKRVFARINADRDITKEMFHAEITLSKNGTGATNIIWKYLSIKDYDQNIIRKELLPCLNKIARPDIDFSDITIKEDQSTNRQGAQGEIYFEDKNGSWVALSDMGSGVKTIILVLLNLIVLPKIKSVKKENLIFAFEELENNLHPSIQRRLFNFISEYALENKCHFFITTHSNVVIDLFFKNKNAQLIHIENVGKYSFAKQVISGLEQRNILKDLDFKTSDLLLSNGIIWVEGPSDAIYIELLLELYKRENEDIQNYNYCIQSLATAIWKYAGFSDFNWEKINSIELENQIISLANLNHNHLIVLDKDDNYEDKKPSEWKEFSNKTGQNKARLIFESMQFANHDEVLLQDNYGECADGRLLFWINDGTFETYLEYFINNNGNDFKKFFDKNKNLKFLEKKRVGKNHSKSKVELAAEIAQFVSASDCSLHDLAPADSKLLNKIEKLVTTIKSWN